MELSKATTRVGRRRGDEVDSEDDGWMEGEKAAIDFSLFFSSSSSSSFVVVSRPSRLPKLNIAILGTGR